MKVANKLNLTKKTFNGFVVVLWLGSYDPGQIQEKEGGRGFILLLPQPAGLLRSDVGSDKVEPAPCFVIIVKSTALTYFFPPINSEDVEAIIKTLKIKNQLYPRTLTLNLLNWLVLSSFQLLVIYLIYMLKQEYSLTI